MNSKTLFLALLSLFTLFSCTSDDDKWIDPTPIPSELINGVYVLNEGNWGANNATLDFFNFDTSEYISDIFTKKNPSIPKDLGDVGNDLKLYKDKLYIVINASNYIEVIDAKTAAHIASITIPNCRNITFQGSYAYITSYAGPIDENKKQLGYVYKINLTNFSEVSKILVGYQPDGLAIANNKLYVANSGGYNAPNYDNRLSVIDLDKFEEIKKITVPANPSKIKVDKNNKIWVTSVGNYADVSPSVSIINPNTDSVINSLSISISDFDFYEDNLYYYGTTWDSNWNSVNTYGIININTQTVTSTQLVNSDVQSKIKSPYGLAVNPYNGDILISDAMDYKSPGKVYFLDKNGNTKWEAKTAAYLPNHFAFLKK